MPFVTPPEEQSLLEELTNDKPEYNIDQPIVPEEQREWEYFGGQLPTTLDVLGAGFARENIFANILRNQSRPGQEDFSFNAVRDADYEEYEEDHEALEYLLESRSQEDFEWRKQRLKENDRNDYILQHSGALGAASQFAGGGIDPTLLIPFGAAYKAFKFGKGFIRTSVIAGADVAGHEAILHQEQARRTKGESIFNIGAAAVLAGLLGGAYAWKRGNDIDVLSRAMDEDLAEEVPKALDDVTPPPRVEQEGEELRFVDPEKASQMTIRNIERGVQRGDFPESYLREAEKLHAEGKWDEVTRYYGARTTASAEEIRHVERMNKTITDVPEDTGVDFDVNAGPLSHMSVGGAATHTTNLHDETMVGIGGGKIGSKIIQKAARVSPMGRLLTSPFLSARKAAQRLARHYYILNKHGRGIANPHSVEARTDLWQGRLAEAKDYNKYMRHTYNNRVDKTQKISRKEWNERVTDAARRGDDDVIPEIAQAAKRYRREVYSPIHKAGIKQGMFNEDTEVLGAVSYINRVYDIDKIIAYSNEFRADLKRAIAKQRPDLEDDIIDSIVEDIKNNITDVYKGTENIHILAETSPLRARRLALPDEFLKKWMINDIDALSSRYVNNVAPRIELHNEFGSIKADDIFEELVNEYNEAASRIPDGTKAKVKLAKDFEAAKRDLAGIRNRLLHVRDTQTFKPGSKGETAIAGAKSLNLTRLLGAVTLSSLLDIARQVMEFGFSRIGKALFSLASHPSLGRMSLQSQRKSAAGIDLILQDASRQLKLSELGTSYARGKAATWINLKTHEYMKLTGLPHWNAFHKQFAGMMTEDLIIDYGSKLLRGKRVGKKLIQKMAVLGVDTDTAKRIAKQFNKYGETHDTLKLSNIERWDDAYAKDTFRVAVNNYVEKTINTPTAGNMPLIFDSDMWSMILMFKSFAFASYEQTLISGVQQFDANFHQGLVMMLGMGAMVTTLKRHMGGYPPPENEKDLLLDAIDSSGLLALPFELDNIMFTASGGRFGVRAMMTDRPPLRYASRNTIDALLGPTAGLVTDSAATFNVLTGREPTAGEIHQMRKMAPLNNLFYLRWLFNEVENGVNDYLGTPHAREKPGLLETLGVE